MNNRSSITRGKKKKTKTKTKMKKVHKNVQNDIAKKNHRNKKRPV